MASGKTGSVELNLFPFMSVLISLMGILMFFLIVIVSTRVMVVHPPLPPPPPPPPSQLGPVGDDAQGDLPPDTPRLPDTEYAAALREVQQLTVRLAQRERDCEDLLRECEQLREVIKMEGEQLAMPQLPTGRAEGASLGAMEKVNIVPDPRGRPVNKRAVIVETQADKFILHPEKTEYPVTQLPQAQSLLRDFLDRVDRDKKQVYLLVLVQPNGVPTYEKLRKCLLSNYSETIEKPHFLGRLLITKSRIDIGVEPFRRDWLYFPEDQASAKKK
jgi:hypothetical protein